MRIVALERDVLVLELVDVRDRGSRLSCRRACSMWFE
jgi:hypothetical protein